MTIRDLSANTGETRVCRKCERLLDLSDFGVDNTCNGVNGRHVFCRACKSAWQRERRAKWTPEQHAADKAARAKSYAKRKEKDPDFIKRQVYLRRAKLIEDGVLDVERERGKKATRSWYRNNREAALSKDKNMRCGLIQNLGGKCVKCHYSADVRALVLDHIHGDGYLDRKRIGSKIYRYYSKNLDEAKEKLQVLCSNCNAIKASELDEHNRTRRIKDAA